jgi:hypothetical protein
MISFKYFACTAEEPVFVIFSFCTRKNRMGTQYKEDVPSSNYGGGAPMGGYVE